MTDKLKELPRDEPTAWAEYAKGRWGDTHATREAFRHGWDAANKQTVRRVLEDALDRQPAGHLCPECRHAPHGETQCAVSLTPNERSAGEQRYCLCGTKYDMRRYRDAEQAESDRRCGYCGGGNDPEVICARCDPNNKREVTDEMVERACKAFYKPSYGEHTDLVVQDRNEMRAALEAALNG